MDPRRLFALRHHAEPFFRAARGGFAYYFAGVGRVTPTGTARSWLKQPRWRRYQEAQR